MFIRKNQYGITAWYWICINAKLPLRHVPFFVIPGVIHPEMESSTAVHFF
jgi:hypothetical protein